MTYERIRSLGRGGTAEVWLARDGHGGLVALKRTPDTAIAVAAAALGHPNVLGVLAVDGNLLVMPYVPGGSLAAALASGARYAPPQAAALGAALADALAAAHAAGVVHGDVKAANVLLADAGTPLLADFRGTGTEREDVRRLAALLTSLGLEAPDAPDAAALRDALRAADLPVDGDDPEPTRGFGPTPPRPPANAAAARRRRTPALPPLRVAVAAAAAVVLAMLTGWSLPGGSTAGALPAAPRADWAATLAALDAARSAAFAQADAAALSAVYVAGSAPHEADTALLTSHARAGRRVADLHLVVVSARAVRQDAGEVELEVVDRLLPYTASDRAGRVVARWPGRGEQRWRITLRRTAAGTGPGTAAGTGPGTGPAWRIARVATPPPGAT